MFGSMTAFGHKGFLTAPNDLCLPLTKQEEVLIARVKPRAPDGHQVPLPNNTDWIKLPFEEIDPPVDHGGGPLKRRIISIYTSLSNHTDEVLRLKEYFGCEKRYRI